MNKYKLLGALEAIVLFIGFIVFVAALVWLGVTLADGEPATDVSGDDYGDAPEEIQDGALDYQDYKETGCPHLDQTLDQRVMKQCNQWIRENNITID